MIPEYKRMQELISGEATPEDQGEFALIKAYQRGEDGEPLINICIDMKEQIDYYTEYEYSMFILGYAIGQKDYLDKIDGLDLSKFKKDDDEPLH